MGIKKNEETKSIDRVGNEQAALIRVKGNRTLLMEYERWRGTECDTLWGIKIIYLSCGSIITVEGEKKRWNKSLKIVDDIKRGGCKKVKKWYGAGTVRDKVAFRACNSTESHRMMMGVVL